MIVRVLRRESGYFTASREGFDNKALSNKAKGILAYALSRPPDWELRFTNIVNSSTDGRDAVQSGIKELIAAGYARYEKTHDLDGQLDGQQLVIRESIAVSWTNHREPGFPATGKTGDRKTRRSNNKEKEVLKRTTNKDSAKAEENLFDFPQEPDRISYREREQDEAIADFAELGGKRGAENRTLFTVFWDLFGAATGEPQWRLMGRFSKTRNDMETLGIDGPSMIRGLYKLHRRGEFERMESSPGYMNALPERVLNYLSATAKRKATETIEQRSSHTEDSHNAIEALFSDRI